MKAPEMGFFGGQGAVILRGGGASLFSVASVMDYPTLWEYLEMNRMMAVNYEEDLGVYQGYL